jgi:antitoxin component YwqK of YwqJK toxin-antitoxin module
MKDQKQGPWVVKTPDLRGERGYEEEGYFENDNKEGAWKKFSLDGVKIAEENYRWGKLNGKQYYYTYNGGLLREESWRAMDPKIAFDTVAVYDLNDPTKIKERVVVKNDGYAVKHGKWVYYDPAEGVVTNTENYWLNKLRTDMDEFIADDDIKPLSLATSGKVVKTDTASKTKAKPKEVMDFEKKNAGKKKVKNRTGETGYLPEP